MADSVTKGIVFVLDFDGVITTLDIDWQRLRHEISASAGVRIDSFLTFFEGSWGTPDFDKVSAMLRTKELEAVHTSHLYPDVQPSLELVQGEKGEIYVSSMQSINALNYFLEAHNIKRYFKRVIGRENLSSKRSQLEWIKQVEEPASERRFIFIDDLERHINTGIEMGFESFLCRRGADQPDALLEMTKRIIQVQV